jgi:hypothetical protein
LPTNSTDVKSLVAIPFHFTRSGFHAFGSILSANKKFFLSGLPSKEDLIIFLLSNSNKNAFVFKINGPAVGAKETYAAQYTNYISRLPIDCKTEWFDITFLAEKRITTRNRTKTAFVTNIISEEICAQSSANLLPPQSDKSISIFNSSILIKYSETAKSLIFDEFGLRNGQEQEQPDIDNRIDYEHVQQTTNEYQSPVQFETETNQFPVYSDEDAQFDYRLSTYLNSGSLNTPFGPAVIPTPNTTFTFFNTFDFNHQLITNTVVQSNEPLSQSIPLVFEQPQQPSPPAQQSLKRKFHQETAQETWMSQNIEYLKNLGKQFQETMSTMVEHVNCSKNEMEERECSIQETSERIGNQMVQLEHAKGQTEQRLLHLRQEEERISQLERIRMENEQMLQQRIAEFEKTRIETEQSFEQQRKKIKNDQEEFEARKIMEAFEINTFTTQKMSLTEEINSIQEKKQRLTLDNASLENDIANKKEKFLKIQEILSNC